MLVVAGLEAEGAGVVRVVVGVDVARFQLHPAGALRQHHLLLLGRHRLGVDLNKVRRCLVSGRQSLRRHGPH